mgnify:CR=1 FL=1|jgi:hypothetical protein|tara:strand:- start:815 stop:1033 length:219 start_codon:yes stop_codon:yes gene_type:complete
MNTPKFSGPGQLILPCAAVAYQEEFCYRCISCYAVVGSIGQPKECREESEKYKTLESLGGKGWDYHLGEQKK